MFLFSCYNMRFYLVLTFNLLNPLKKMNTKNALLIIAAGLLLCIHACKPAGVEPTTATIAGKWNIVSDSTFAGVGSSNHPVDYGGQPGDYFDFTSNGIIYTKEGLTLDTLNYTVTGDNSIVITAFGLIANGVPATSQIKTLTIHSLVIKAPTVLTPGGEFGREVYLSR
jgi:hypothetical protein